MELRGARPGHLRLNKGYPVRDSRSAPGTDKYPAILENVLPNSRQLVSQRTSAFSALATLADELVTARLQTRSSVMTLLKLNQSFSP